MFSWAGAVQIPLGLTPMLVAARYRPLRPAILRLNGLELGVLAPAAWVLFPALHHPPEHYASPVSAVLLLVFCVVAAHRMSFAVRGTRTFITPAKGLRP